MFLLVTENVGGGPGLPLQCGQTYQEAEHSTLLSGSLALVQLSTAESPKVTSPR